MERHLIIRDVAPAVDGGRYSVKRVVGDRLAVGATVFRDGHDVVRATVRWWRDGEAPQEAPLTLVNRGLDRWEGGFVLAGIGRTTFTVVAWTDRLASWLADLRQRVETGQADVSSEVLEGAQLLGRLVPRADAGERPGLKAALAELRDGGARPRQALATAERLGGALHPLQPREDEVEFEPALPVWADRPRARYGAWYELFVRSQGTEPGRGATFREAERRLLDVAGMGFDVLYLAPIHPIGRTRRKGRDNALEAEPGDPGSPWAIGSEAGGHDAVEPSLGTIDDFDHFRAAAERVGLELALDLALQCSPDHPWVKEHPDWFFHRPDGTIKYAENPPKKYQDVYPVDFDCEDRRSLWREVRRVVQFWIDHGVRIFRVDNPHTKPLVFWRWLIEDVQREHPEVLFLAEAFTRPPMMQELARLGFSQSYTYFTWRNTRQELTSYLEELTREQSDHFRPNFFVNTPDILPEILQRGGRPAFRMRAALAATLSPSYGIYSGFELCEHEAIEGREEYRNSEKYEIKVRDWDAPGHLKDYLRRLNEIRRDNPALQDLNSVRFLESDNDQILFYCKSTPDRSNVLLVAVNLDPLRRQQGNVLVPAAEIGVEGDSFEVQELIGGARYTWTGRNYVQLDPQREEQAQVFRVLRGE